MGLFRFQPKKGGRMAIIIEANYSKKLGLPAYSSHSYSVTIRSEVADLSQVERESAKLYAILQGSVDREIQEVGFIPEANGQLSAAPRTNNGSASQSNGDQWACSDKQRDLILKIVDEHRLDKQEVEGLTKDMFQKPVKTLNKLEASGLIEELLEKYGPKKTNGGRSYQRGARR
jgi:hypothetical protein